MHLKSLVSNLALAVVAVVAIGIATGIHVRTQAPFLVFGSSSGSSQVVKSTSNALWVSIQSMAAAATLCWTGRACISSPGDGLINITNNTASAGIGLDASSDGLLRIRVRAQNAFSQISAGSYSLNDVQTIFGTAPTVTSGFGSGSAGTIVTGSTSFNFRITVGTNAGGTTGVIGLPTANNFWNCRLTDQNTPADITNQTASTVNSATFTTTVTWTTGDVLTGGCTSS